MNGDALFCKLRDSFKQYLDALGAIEKAEEADEYIVSVEMTLRTPPLRCVPFGRNGRDVAANRNHTNRRCECFKLLGECVVVAIVGDDDTIGVLGQLSNAPGAQSSFVSGGGGDVGTHRHTRSARCRQRMAQAKRVMVVGC